MPKPGYVSFTVKNEDMNRLFDAACDILEESPVKVADLSLAEQLRLLLNEHEASNKEPEEDN